MSFILALDSATADSSVAILDRATNKHCIGKSSQLPQLTNLESIQMQNDNLHLMIEQLCKQINCQLDQISAIVVGNGPGSFTGLRIGFSLAKALAQGLEVPLFVYSSLAAAAYVYSLQNPDNLSKKIMPILDAKRDQYFAGGYKTTSSFENLSADGIYELKDLEALQVEGYTLLALEKGLKIGLESDLNLALGLAQLALKFANLNAEFKLENLVNLEPNYIRTVSAKTINERQQGS